jgi:ParB family chromosome partitioning protein
LSKLSLTAYEDLFETEESRQDSKQERIETLSLELLYPFPDHPFKVRDDEKMDETVESVRQYGVLVPILTRPRPEGGYQIVSGHRRVHASKRAGLENISAIIRDMTDDEATIVMVDSNLQREQLLPSEKAFAYRMKLEAMKHQGQRVDLTSSQFGTKLRSDELLAVQTGDSRNQIARYIRLTYLTHPLLDKVDENTFAINAAVEISYLSEAQQQLLVEAMDYAQVSPSIAQARKIRAFSASDKLDINVLEAILSEEKPLERKITLRNDKLKKYFPAEYTPLQMEAIITQLLEDWSRKRQKEGADRGR